MYQELINKAKPSLDKIIDYLRTGLASLQVGRATSTLIEGLEVDVYDQKMPLKQLAAIQVSDPRMIIVRPWDKTVIRNIEWAIRQSNLGLSPVVEEDHIRLRIPALSEERRKELAKILHEKLEECKISIRRQRGEIWERIQTMEQSKEITEDDKFKAKGKLQELVDDYNKEIEEIGKKKEKEIMTI